MNKLSTSRREKHLIAPAAGSVEEIAGHIGISRTGIFALIKSGKLPCVKVGRRTLVRYADADALLAEALERRA